MARYERIRLNGRTLYLNIDTENDQFLRGVEVDRLGDEIRGRDFDRRVHLIDKLAITRRTPMQMSLMYAELEERTQNAR